MVAISEREQNNDVHDRKKAHHQTATKERRNKKKERKKLSIAFLVNFGQFSQHTQHDDGGDQMLNVFLLRPSVGPTVRCSVLCV